MLVGQQASFIFGAASYTVPSHLNEREERWEREKGRAKRPLSHLPLRVICIMRETPGCEAVFEN